MDTHRLKELFAQSDAGEIIFPNLVKEFSQMGMESYRVDLLSLQKTCYFISGETYQEPLPDPDLAVAVPYSADGILSAIREAQAGTIKFPEFLARIAKAGITQYTTYLTGHQVIYFGRKGEQHREPFPAALIAML